MSRLLVPRYVTVVSFLARTLSCQSSRQNGSRRTGETPLTSIGLQEIITFHHTVSTHCVMVMVEWGGDWVRWITFTHLWTNFRGRFFLRLTREGETRFVEPIPSSSLNGRGDTPSYHKSSVWDCMVGDTTSKCRGQRLWLATVISLEGLLNRRSYVVEV